MHTSQKQNNIKIKQQVRELVVFFFLLAALTTQWTNNKIRCRIYCGHWQSAPAERKAQLGFKVLIGLDLFELPLVRAFAQIEKLVLEILRHNEGAQFFIALQAIRCVSAVVEQIPQAQFVLLFLEALKEALRRYQTLIQERKFLI